jgi:hypothetical protein
MYESKQSWIVRDNAFNNIQEGKSYWGSIFTDELDKLSEFDQNMVIGSLQAEFGHTFKEFIELLVEESLNSK